MTIARAVFVVLVVAVLAALSGTDDARAVERVAPENAAQVQMSYAPVVKKTAPAVVNVYTAKMVRTRAVSPLFNDPFFRRFFGDLAPQIPGPERQVQNALGSGVLIDGAGVVVTNNHVVEGADEIKVVLHDRREFAASVVGLDARTDIAVLKLDLSGQTLPFLELSNSDDVEVGDLVLAIGNPFGVGQTVTSGIVSALARTNVGVSDLNSFIQTDAAINPGNSGGALVDISGRLIGINTAIFSKTGGSHGIGFAIPSNMVSYVVKSLLASGGVKRAWWGATGQDISADVAQVLGMERPVGVVVTSIYPGGSAERAGLQVGDAIVSVAGHDVLNAQDLRFRIATQPIGTDIDVSIIRQGEAMNIRLTMEAPPETPKRERTLLKGRHPFSGAVVANLSPALADEVGLPYLTTGVLILELSPTDSAARLGLEPGDIIRRVNNQDIKSVRDLQQIISQTKAGWLIGISRGGNDMNMVIR